MSAISHIDHAGFLELARPFVGKPVTFAWLGDYTALYLEVGAVTGEYSGSGRPKSDHTAYLGFDWILEREDGPPLASTHPEATQRIEATLTEEVISGLSVSPSFHLAVSFRSGAILRSVAASSRDPDWTLFLPSGQCLAPDANSLVLDSRAA